MTIIEKKKSCKQLMYSHSEKNSAMHVNESTVQQLSQLSTGYDSLKDLQLKVIAGLTNGQAILTYRVWEDPMLYQLTFTNGPRPSILFCRN